MKELPPINLSSLKLCNCPNLDKVPDMLFSLMEFHVQNVGLTSLPNFHQCSTNNTTATDFQKSSLIVVVIHECTNLITLDGFLQQGNLYMQAIESLTIVECERLVNLPTQGFGNLTSLKQLTLRDCPKLVIMEIQGNLLPKNLQKLEIMNCGELDVPLLKASSVLTNLANLDISDCANITSIIVQVRSLRLLHIRGCCRLVGLLFLEEAHEINQHSNFNILKKSRVYIWDCPSLTRISNLPFSLIDFSIRNVALTSVPEYNVSSNSYGNPSTTSLESLLRSVEISNCQNLTSLNGGFGKFVSLTRLAITDCPILVVVDNQSNLLPRALESLEIKNCGELDEPLLESASRLTTLTELRIRKCANINHILCSENAFVSLNKLCIKECEKLIENSFRELAQGVNLQGSSLASLKINYLKIDHLSLLLIEPLRSLRFVGELEVFNCSGMEALPEQWLQQNSSTLRSLKIRDARTVKSLPATMTSLTALEKLEIDNANLLKELPLLPASLRSFDILGAKSLKSLPATMTNLTALTQLYITNADFLEELPVLPLSLIDKSIRRSDGVELLT